MGTNGNGTSGTYPWEVYLKEAYHHDTLPGGMEDLEDPWGTARNVFLGTIRDQWGLIDDLTTWMIETGVGMDK